jgi:hypothetical protein
MHPILFEIGGFPIYTYGLLLAAAYLLGLQFALKRARRRGLDPNRVMDLGIWIIVSALAGAKLLLLIVEWDTYTASFSQLLTLIRSGGVFYGGLIAAVTVALWYLWRHRMPVWQVTDVFAPGIALGHVIGRLGCLFAGCCFGKPTSVPWAITFHNKYAEQNVGTPLEVPLHPGGAARHRAQRASFPWPDVLGLHAVLWHLPLHHRVLPRRQPGSGRHVLHIAVRLAVDHSAQHRHVGISAPPLHSRTDVGGTTSQGRVSWPAR